VLLAKICLFHAIDLGKLDVFLSEESSSFFIMRRKSLAMPAPRKLLRLG